MTSTKDRQVLALFFGCALLGVGLSALVAWIMDNPPVSIRIVTQREIDDTVAELVRQAREDFQHGH
jgi:uncharacterized iron-regulated membrane protein